MFLNNSSLVLLAVYVFVRVFAYKSDDSRSICDYVADHSSFNGVTCCKNQSLRPGIGNLKQWKECGIAPTDEDEAYHATMWRIYICMIQEILPLGQTTISLVEFGNGMTNEYPETLKIKINERIKYFATHDTKNKSVAMIEADLKDIEKIEQMRGNYFDIEKKICGWTEDLSYEVNEMNGTGCSVSEEWNHRGGECCNNRTIPKREPIEPTPLNLCSELPSDSKRVLTVEELILFNVSDELPIEKILNALMPNYYSKNVRKQMQENLAKYNYTTRSFVPDSSDLYDSFLPVEMNGCRVHSELRWRISPWYLEICHWV